MSRWPASLFRPAKHRSQAVIAFCTLQQVVVFWGFFLFLVPWLLYLGQRSLDLTFFEPGFGRWIAVGLFGLLGSTALFCASLFIRFGNGTPLPLDQTTRLVILGPYLYVRNPMAICGIGQGVAVGWFLGSWPVMVYAGCGALAWQFLARPLEEADMLRRFGEPYARYKEAVPIWMPTLRRYPKAQGSLEERPEA